jgi:hypothetical protein
MGMDGMYVRAWQGWHVIDTQSIIIPALCHCQNKNSICGKQKQSTMKSENETHNET